LIILDSFFLGVSFGAEKEMVATWEEINPTAREEASNLLNECLTDITSRSFQNSHTILIYHDLMKWEIEAKEKYVL
jgi:hypothetical protein